MAQMNCHFYSYTLGHGTDIFLVIPSLSPCDGKPGERPSHKSAGRYPVLYLLHGHGNDYMSWPSFTSMARYAEERRIAMVTVDTGNEAFLNMPGHEQYADFLEQELPEFLCANFNVSAKREDTYLAGLSMGGYGTLAHALCRPERYAAVGAFSPAVRLSDYAAGRSLANAVDLYRQLDAVAPRKDALPKLYMSCGENDFLFHDVEDFYRAASAKGVEIDYRVIPEREHEWRLWDSELPRFLDWLPRTDAYSRMEPHKI